MSQTHPLLRQLNAEWQALGPVQLPAAWRAEPTLAWASDLGEVLASIRSTPDDVLGALLRCGDATAHRVVLQAMLGCAVRDAARDPSHELGEYIAELWLRIATYPLAARPAAIAANLALDTRKRVRAGAPIAVSGTAALDDLAAPETIPSESLLLARARRTAVIDLATERELRLVYCEGLGAVRAASVLGVRPATLRQRCHRALRRLAAHVPDLQEVVAS